jgi:hypothetical protein
MNQPDDGLLERLLTNAQLIHVGLWGSLIENDIENLTYVTATEGEAPPQAPIPTGPGKRGILRAVLAYIRYCGTQPDPIGDDWLDVTQVEFDLYRISPLFNGTIFGNPMSTTTGGSAASSAGAPRDPVADFKRGIKRDPSQFPTLKDEKQLDNWDRTNQAQARAQGVEQILDSSYVPTTTEDTALFEVKQTYMFAVFEKTLLTDQSKAYVREFEQESDAQSIYRRISEHAIKSTEASLEASHSRTGHSWTIGTVLTKLKPEHKALSKSWTRPTFRQLQKTRHCSKSSKHICSQYSKRLF